MTRVALTYDDGPGPSTADLLDILRSFRVHATFFVLGKSIEEALWCAGDTARARALVVRELRDGHVVGNHSYSHAGPADHLHFPADLLRNDEIIRARRREAGLPENAPIAVRLPYGIKLVEQTIDVQTGTLQVAVLDPRLPLLASIGRTHVHWTSDFGDWTLGPGDGQMLAARMIEHVARNEALGLDAVLDLHDSGTGSQYGYERPATITATREFLAEAARRGWEIVTVPA